MPNVCFSELAFTPVFLNFLRSNPMKKTAVIAAGLLLASRSLCRMWGETQTERQKPYSPSQTKD